jgi:hypothetical protein
VATCSWSYAAHWINQRAADLHGSSFERPWDAGTDRATMLWGGTDLHACGTSTFNAFGYVHLQHEGIHISI